VDPEQLRQVVREPLLQVAPELSQREVLAQLLPAVRGQLRQVDPEPLLLVVPEQLRQVGHEQ
jgi:hypothetical protein